MNTDTDTDALALLQLTKLRSSIDNLDAIIIHTLAERFKATQEVGKLKAVHNMPPADKDREARQIDRLRRLAQESGLDPAFAEKLLNINNSLSQPIEHYRVVLGIHNLGFNSVVQGRLSSSDSAKHQGGKVSCTGNGG